jgi:DNA-binding PadR family transcriptional regulator
MAKSQTSEKTIYKRKVLEILSYLKPSEEITRNELRAILKIDIAKGSLHHALDDMENDGLIIQDKIPNPDGGNNLGVAKITEKGLGYLQCLEDYGIGKSGTSKITEKGKGYIQCLKDYGIEKE